MYLGKERVLEILVPNVSLGQRRVLELLVPNVSLGQRRVLKILVPNVSGQRRVLEKLGRVKISPALVTAGRHATCYHKLSWEQHHCTSNARNRDRYQISIEFARLVKSTSKSKYFK